MPSSSSRVRLLGKDGVGATLKGSTVDKEQFFGEARGDRTGPIDGLRILECTTTWAGPMAGCVLGDLGADVIKVELPDGEITRTMEPFLPGTELSFVHETVNRNKRCLTLDLAGRRPRRGSCGSFGSGCLETPRRDR